MTLLRSVFALALLFVSGCRIATPDGVSFLSGSSEAEVRARLGDPELKEDHTRNVGSCIFKDFRATTDLYYIERGYVAVFDKDRLLGIQVNPEARTELERRVRVNKEMAALAPGGSSSAAVISKLGDPDLVYEDLGRYLKVWLYRPRFVERPFPRLTAFCFLDRGVAVGFKDGHVSSVQVYRMDSTLLSSMRHEWEWMTRREKLAEEDPPRAGMDGSTIKERWGEPQAESEGSGAEERLQLPRLAPHAPDRAAVTRWFYPTRHMVVLMRDDVAVSVERTDPATDARVEDFVARADDLWFQGKTLVERLH